MGESGKSPTRSYRFVDHARYLDAWFEALDLRNNVILVVHDWGSALGFHRAHRSPEQIQAIAYMEAIVQPRTWEDFGDNAGIFHALRSDRGEQRILDENGFIELVFTFCGSRAAHGHGKSNSDHGSKNSDLPGRC